MQIANRKIVKPIYKLVFMVSTLFIFANLSYSQDHVICDPTLPGFNTTTFMQTNPFPSTTFASTD